MYFYACLAQFLYPIAFKKAPAADGIGQYGAVYASGFGGKDFI